MDRKSIKMMSLLIAVLMVLTVTACGGGKTDPADGQDSGQTVEQKTEEDKAPQSEDYPKTMYVNSEDGLMLRKEAGTDKEEIQALGYGEAIEVDRIENGWAHTTFDGHEGWCSAEYLTEDKPAIKTEKTTSGNGSDKLVEPDNVAEYGEHGTIVSPEGVNMRYGPGENYGVITGIPDNAQVIEKGWAEGWVYVQYDGQYGWVKSEYFVTQGGGKEKPVIYLYPTRTMDVFVKVDLTDGRFTKTIPEGNGEWTVRAQPDGKLTDKSSGKTYDYIFWESSDDTEYDWSEGYVIEGGKTEAFLRSILPQMGLNAKEYNEFIGYWLPRMEKNRYNLITFQTECYTDSAKLTVSPQPDSMLRVFMAFKAVPCPVSVKRPEITPFIRKGFTVVEWGGAEVRED